MDRNLQTTLPLSWAKCFWILSSQGSYFNKSLVLSNQLGANQAPNHCLEGTKPLPGSTMFINRNTLHESAMSYLRGMCNSPISGRRCTFGENWETDLESLFFSLPKSQKFADLRHRCHVISLFCSNWYAVAKSNRKSMEKSANYKFNFSQVTCHCESTMTRTLLWKYQPSMEQHKIMCKMHSSRADSFFAPANEKRCYFVTTSLIGWAQT